MPRQRHARPAGRSLAFDLRLGILTLAIAGLAVALAGCGGDDSDLTGDLAGPEGMPSAATDDAARPRFYDRDPIEHLTTALDAAQISGSEREQVDRLIADFSTKHADQLARLKRAGEKARTEASQGNPPDRARWHTLLAEEGLTPGALREEMQGLHRAIGETLSPEQRERLHEQWRQARRGRHAWRERVVRDLELTPEQESEIQRLITEFRGSHEGEIAALAGVIAQLGDNWPGGPGRGRGGRGQGFGPGPGAGPGPGNGECPGPGPGPGPHAGPGAGLGPGPHAGPGACRADSAGPGYGAGRGLGPHLRDDFKAALTQAGYDPEAFRADLVRLHDEVIALLTPEQLERARPGLHLLRRILKP